VDRLFLDANVLFSASWKETSAIAELWTIGHATLVTSAYAFAETARNIEDEAHRARLHRLMQHVEVLPGVRSGKALPAGISLRAKDRPILLAAIASGATHLITGDLRDFGPLFGRRVGGVLVLRPRDYLARR
jgi:predicted nucleic acid-binding protein